MHWTALLAYRRFPPNALVIDDLACIGCGYNLRGIRVGARCPECGGHVGDSLFLLAKPDVVGHALNGVGKSFLASFALLLVFISSATWMPMLATGVLVLGAIWRVFHAAELRYRGAIVRLPVIGTHVEVFWWCIVIDAMVTLGFFAIAVLFAMDPVAITPRLLTLGLVGWLMTTMLCLAAAGWMGKPFAVMLGYGWMAIEFSIQRTWAVASLAFALVLMFVIASGSPRTPVLIAFAVFALVFAGQLLLTTVTLLQLANAAYRSSDTLDDAIDVYAGDAKQPVTSSHPVNQRPGIPLVRE